MDEKNNISEEKLQWMKEKGFKKFKNPMVYSLGNNHVFSEEYIAITPLEELRAKFDDKLVRGAHAAGNKSLNQLRIENGLEPLDDELFTKKFTIE